MKGETRLIVTYFFNYLFAIFIAIMLLGDFGLKYFPWGASYYIFRSYPSGLSIFFSDIYIMLLLLLPHLKVRSIIHFNNFFWLRWFVYILISYALVLVYFYGVSAVWHILNSSIAKHDPGGFYSYPLVQVVIYVMFVFYLSYSYRVFGLNYFTITILNFSNIIYSYIIYRDVMPRVMGL